MAPWELLEQPAYWRESAVAFLSVENSVEEEIEKERQRKMKHRRAVSSHR